MISLWVESEETVVALSTQSEIMLFRCGHIYHRSCLEGSIGFGEEPVCVLCNKSNAIRTFGYRRSNSRSEKRDKRPAAKKKGAGKRVDVQGNLSLEQQTALDNLWSYGRNSIKPSDFSEGPIHRSRVLISRASSFVSEPVDSKFALRLDPPPLRNNVN